MARTESGDYKEALDIADARERAQEADEQAQADAEHAVMMMVHDDPASLMDLFHDKATSADLDAMDEALASYIKTLGEDEPSAFYDALVRIVKEHGNVE